MILLLAAITAGAIPMSVANNSNPIDSLNQADRSPHSQGIQGKVVRMAGNLMPSGGQPQPRSQPRNHRQPVQTQVWIFSGRIPGAATTWPVQAASQHPQFRQQITSDAAGQFSVELPPGEYTLFAQYDTVLHLNSFLGDGAYASVQVEPQQMTEVELVNQDGAAF